MPRALRIEYADAWYHVMNRGAGCRSIFKTNQHRQLFLNTVKEAIIQFEIEVHAYCLMDNHYHLLIKTPHANLGKAMRHINGVYTQRFNKDQKTDGPLFRGRYKALIVEKESYLLQVSRYIHLNPVNAKIAKSLESYPWSSYIDYINKKNSIDWLTVDEVRSMLHASNHRLAYAKYVSAGIDKETQRFYEKKNMPIILGSKLFKEKILKDVESEKISPSQSDYNQIRILPSMTDVDHLCATYFKVDQNELLKTHHKGNEARKIAIYGSRVWAKEKNLVIAQHYHCNSAANVSNTVKNINERIKTDPKFAEVIQKLRKRLFK